jgi:hypothetical protein
VSDSAVEREAAGVATKVERLCAQYLASDNGLAKKNLGNKREQANARVLMCKLRPGLEPGISSLLVMRFTAKPPELTMSA